MKKAIILLALGLIAGTSAQAQTIALKPQPVTTSVPSEKHISSSILLWVRTDKPRQAGMERWKGPHSKIISANKGLEEYRQIHLTETNPGLWPAVNGVETSIPANRKIDGIADVTLKNIFSIFRGKKQNKLAYADEVNLFKRTILYAALGATSRWYAVNPTNEKTGARSVVFFRIKEGVDKKDFARFINQELTPILANTGVLTELRPKVYMPWKQKQWDTPNVAHDNPKKVQFQASVMLGFANKKAMTDFFASDAVNKLAGKLAAYTSAVHAYEIAETLTYVKDGKQLDHYQN
ncbi:strictosidine synthase [Spirosoma linguale]